MPGVAGPRAPWNESIPGFREGLAAVEREFMDAHDPLNRASSGETSPGLFHARRRALKWRFPSRTAKRLAGWWCLSLFLSAPVSTASAGFGAWQMDADESVVGRTAVYVARHEDTLLDIARRFRMGIAELRHANPGVDVWLPGEGIPIRIPSRFILPDAPRTGVVINLPEMRIYHYPKDGSVVHTWPISIGRVGWETPLGMTTVVRKKARPTWYPPESVREDYARQGKVLPRVVGPGPDNPLGSHALYLGLPAYLIHGTNKPYSIGMRVSYGCVRLYPEHIGELFDMVDPGTLVTLVHQGVKAGWAGNELYIEVHPTTDVGDGEGRPGMTEAVRALIAATSAQGLPPALDWNRVEEALETASGIPVAVARRPAALAASAGDAVH